MNTLKIKILLCCFMVTGMFAQQKLSKVSKSINADSDVTIDLNTSYCEIEIETWTKNAIEIEAYIESSKLSKEELQDVLAAWDLKVSGSGDYVTITSNSGRFGHLEEGDYARVLRELELRLADIPEMPEMPEMPELMVMPNMADMPEIPEMPEMPEFPELPELPEGVNSINFDYDAYKKDGEKYLERWSKEYEEEYGKEFKEKMKEWGRKFGESDYQEKMEKWGEEYGKRFEGEWAAKMEAWGKEYGEKFGKDWEKKMEKWSKEIEKSFGKDFEKRMEEWGERYGEQVERQARRLEEQAERYEERREKRDRQLAERYAERAERVKERAEERRERAEEIAERRDRSLARRLESRGKSKVKKTIKIKMPKKAKLKMNVRHGELKFSSVIYDLDADISHSTLVADHIDGRNTSINVSYSPVLITNWSQGELKLNYVDEAKIKNADRLMLSSNSSNITIDKLSGNAIIDGSFGDLIVTRISDSFKNLNLILENSDAVVSLPDTDYSLLFKGERSRFNNEMTTKKVINKYPDGRDADKTIVVNAKFSTVIMQ